MSSQFEDETFAIDTVFGRLQVTVAGDALNLLRGDCGPDDGQVLIAANRDMIEQVATMKFEAGEAAGDYAVRITRLDLED